MSNVKNVKHVKCQMPNISMSSMSNVKCKLSKMSKCQMSNVRCQKCQMSNAKLLFRANFGSSDCLSAFTMSKPQKPLHVTPFPFSLQTPETVK